MLLDLGLPPASGIRRCLNGDRILLFWKRKTRRTTSATTSTTATADTDTMVAVSESMVELSSGSPVPPAETSRGISHLGPVTLDGQWQLAWCRSWDTWQVPPFRQCLWHGFINCTRKVVGNRV